MRGASRRLLNSLLPPLVVELVRRVKRRPIRFSGDYESWQLASTSAMGYDSSEILSRAAVATRKVVRGEAAYERDTVTFDRIEYSWPMLACLMQVGLERGSLRVIDFGGSLGSSWRQNDRFLSRLQIPITWNVVELRELVTLGNAEFAGDTLRFFDTMDEAAGRGVDVVLFASSLCYLEDPAAMIRAAESVGAPFLIVDRLPLISGSRDRILVQHVTEPIYNASYPIWLFHESGLLGGLFGAWKVIEQWDNDLQPDPNSRSRGFFLERK